MFMNWKVAHFGNIRHTKDSPSDDSESNSRRNRRINNFET